MPPSDELAAIDVAGPSATAATPDAFIPLESIAAPPTKNPDAFIPLGTVQPDIEENKSWGGLDVSPAKPPGKVSTLALWARNFLTGRSWVMNLNVTATNRCTQTCPMCNAYVLAQDNPAMLTAEDFALYLEKLAPYRIAACTICGGEPTIVPDMPEILTLAQKHFPFGVMIISNFYGNTKRIMRVMETALRLNIKINCSFDGFGEAADKQRGARRVSEMVLRHLKMVIQRKKELGSRSPITLHTVLSDLNVKQYPQILELCRELGVFHSVGPVNTFDYDQCNPGEMPTLTPSPDLDQAIAAALESGVLAGESHAFIRGIPAYAARQSPKVCPYLTPGLKRMYLFMEPNGDIALCDRKPIGNLRTQTLEEMFQSEAYQERLETFIKPCPGCWYSCFVELPLSLQPRNILRLDFLHQRLPQQKALAEA